MKKVLLFFAMSLMSMAMFAGKIYFRPNETFADANAKFAVYYFGHASETAAFTDYLQLAESQSNIYKAEIPAGFPKIIFVRFDPNRTAAIDWSGIWGQTVDIELQDGKDMYTINSDSRDEGKWNDGSWSVFGAPEPVITKDTTMYVAGNFTNWASGMTLLPANVNFPKDSTIIFKQVRVITTYEGENENMVEVKRDTTWFGQAGADGQMSRGNSAWVLDGGYDVLFTTDAEGEYTFALEGNVFTVTFPELPESCTPNFGLLVNGTDYYAGAENIEANQWEILNIDLVAGDMLQAKDTCSGAAWAPAFIDHMEYFGEDGKLLEDGKYSFYLKLNSGNDELYIVKEGIVDCTPEFGLLVNGADYYAGAENIEANQWEILNIDLVAGDMLQAKDTCSGAAWVPAFIDHMEYFGEDGKLLEDGKYSFYLKLIPGGDELYIVKEDIVDCTPEFGLLVNETDYYAGVENIESNQWEIKNVILVAGDMLQAKDTCSGAAWVPAFIDHMEYFGEDGKLLEDGKYSFYLKLIPGGDELYIVKENAEGLREAVNSNTNIRKALRDGQLYIIRDEKVYTAQGIEIR